MQEWVTGAWLWRGLVGQGVVGRVCRIPSFPALPMLRVLRQWAVRTVDCAGFINFPRTGLNVAGLSVKNDGAGGVCVLGELVGQAIVSEARS
jgi:hypothetical protein